MLSGATYNPWSRNLTVTFAESTIVYACDVAVPQLFCAVITPAVTPVGTVALMVVSLVMLNDDESALKFTLVILFRCVPFNL